MLYLLNASVYDTKDDSNVGIVVPKECKEGEILLLVSAQERHQKHLQQWSQTRFALSGDIVSIIMYFASLDVIHVVGIACCGYFIYYFNDFSCSDNNAPVHAITYYFSSGSFTCFSLCIHFTVIFIAFPQKAVRENRRTRT